MVKVGIIGLGHIAAKYGSPDSLNPYCHAGGIRFSDQVELTAVADLSEAALSAFREEWGAVFPDVHYYQSTSAMLEQESLDIVAICVRGPYHYQVAKDVLAAKPKAIFLEKPPTCSLEEMDELVALAAELRIPITASYSRHWAPHILKLQQLVQDGLIGDVQKVVGYTGGDVLSFASHTTDLICQFAGYEPATVFATGKAGRPAPAGYEDEPALDAMVISFANGVTGIQVGAAGMHGDFYCEVFGTKGKVRAGMYVAPYACDSEGNEVDLSEYDSRDTTSVFTVAYNQIAGYLNGGAAPHCSDDAFICIHEIGFGAIESIRTGAPIGLPNTNRTRKIFANG
ncbi:Gfo/Idh/MocA family protein [Paenibacillus silvisoli]|uniref:Gfo/Idh/MocA family protein n=1 Tax=Paenibacillus silvisoli TaxID=3110539 RepID=UPI002806449D|nr:Gfo/Idh/MocA family oxidoreductase [Paenibacillus silvisoli]